MRLPTDVVYGLPIDHPAASSPPASVWRLCERLADAHALVREKLPAVHRHQKANFDRHAVSMSFTEGDLVWLLTPSVGVGLSSKFSSPWRGPYEVVDCLANGVNYRLRATWAPHRLVVAHVNRMKPCHRRPADLTSGTLTSGWGMPAVGSFRKRTFRYAARVYSFFLRRRR